MPRDRDETKLAASAYAWGRQDEAGETDTDRRTRAHTFAAAYADAWWLYYRNWTIPTMVTLMHAWDNWLRDGTVWDANACGRCGRVLTDDTRATPITAEPGLRRCWRCHAQEIYAKNDRVELVETTDETTQLKPGDRGTVAYVDSEGTVHISWDSGSHLGMVLKGGDKIRILLDPAIPLPVPAMLAQAEQAQAHVGITATTRRRGRHD